MFVATEQIESAFSDVGQPNLGAWMAEQSQLSLAIRYGRGSHRVGGLPNLPLDVDWPTRAALPHADHPDVVEWSRHLAADEPAWGAPNPLTFVASIDCTAAAASAGPAWPFPRFGTLSVFWDPLWGCYGQGCRNTTVLHTTDSGSPRVPPEGVAVLGSHAFDTEVQLSVPSDAYASQIYPGDYDFRAAREVLHSFADPFSTRSDRILGWPCPVQGEPSLEAMNQWRGVSDAPLWHETQYPRFQDAVASAAREASLLLALNLGPLGPGFDGSIFVYVPTEDVVNGRFDRTCTVFQ